VEMAVEALHEASGEEVGNTPQRGENGVGACVLKGMGEPDEAFASHLLSQGRVAGREGYQVGGERYAQLHLTRERFQPCYALFKKGLHGF
jgi:hypothetical protein